MRYLEKSFSVRAGSDKISDEDWKRAFSEPLKMFELSVDEAILMAGGKTDFRDHHYTGPPGNQQEPCNGSVFHEEGLILANFAETRRENVLEIGADQGVSTRYICEGLNRAIGMCPAVYSLDIHHKWPEDLCALWAPRRMVNADSRTWRPEPGTLFSWAFIDGDHSYEAVRDDIKTALACGVTLMVFHDGKMEDVRRAVEDHFKEAEAAAWIVYEVESQCGMFIAEKVKP